MLKTLNNRKRRHLIEFKFTNDNDFVRNKFLKFIANSDTDCGAIIIKKTAVRPDLRTDKGRLYNYLIAEYLVGTLLANYEELNHINLHLDLSMNESSRERFNYYFSNKISWKTMTSDRKYPITNRVTHDYSHNEPCIQIADYLSGSLFQFYERGVDTYFTMIEHKIKYQKIWE